MRGDTPARRTWRARIILVLQRLIMRGDTHARIIPTCPGKAALAWAVMLTGIGVSMVNGGIYIWPGRVPSKLLNYGSNIVEGFRIVWNLVRAATRNIMPARPQQGVLCIFALRIFVFLSSSASLGGWITFIWSGWGAG